MRRRVKRRLFLMSMALATGASGSSFAKGGGKTIDDAHPYSSGWQNARIFTIPDDEVRDTETKHTVLFSKLKAILGNLNYQADVPSAASDVRGWRLEMLQSEAKSEQATDPRLEKGTRLGLALRVKF